MNERELEHRARQLIGMVSENTAKLAAAQTEPERKMFTIFRETAVTELVKMAVHKHE